MNVCQCTLFRVDISNIEHQYYAEMNEGLSYIVDFVVLSCKEMMKRKQEKKNYNINEMYVYSLLGMFVGMYVT